MSTNEVITPTANQSVSTPMMEAIQSVTRQGARALRNYNQPQEWKLISLRECPTPESLQLCDTPDMAANYWRANVVTNPYFNPECETLAVLMLNTRRRVKGHCVVSIGTMDTILVHPREVFRLAVIASAHAIIIMHNLCAAAHKLCYVEFGFMWSTRTKAMTEAVPSWFCGSGASHN